MRPHTNVLCRIYSKPREANGEQVNKVGCDPVLDIWLLRVEVGEAEEPAFGNRLAIGPVADR